MMESMMVALKHSEIHSAGMLASRKQKESLTAAHLAYSTRKDSMAAAHLAGTMAVTLANQTKKELLMADYLEQH